MKFAYTHCLVFLLFFVMTLNIQAAEPIPPELQNIGVDEKLGTTIPLGLVFQDEDGKEVKLQEFFKNGKPVILTLIYYGCPNLCGFLLNGFVDSLKEFPWTPGKEFNVLTVSIDPTENPELAKQKKDSILKMYGREVSDSSWRFLTSTGDNASKLSSSVGFKYRYDEAEKQYAHSAAIFVLTPDGKVSRYLYGIQFPVRDLKFSLIEASQGKMGSVVDKLLMFCYHYDPKGKKYALMATNLMKVAAGVTVFSLLIFLIYQLKSKRT